MSTENSIAVESKSTLENLQAVVEKHPLTGRHSYFQLKYFIVGKEPTPQAKIWQCLREMKARRDRHRTAEKPPEGSVRHRRAGRRRTDFEAA
jgi:prephenate dehydrogenase